MNIIEVRETLREFSFPEHEHTDEDIMRIAQSSFYKKIKAHKEITKHLRQIGDELGIYKLIDWLGNKLRSLK